MRLYDASNGFHGTTTSNFAFSLTSRTLSSEVRGPNISEAVSQEVDPEELEKAFAEIGSNRV